MKNYPACPALGLALALWSLSYITAGAQILTVTENGNGEVYYPAVDYAFSLTFSINEADAFQTQSTVSGATYSFTTPGSASYNLNIGPLSVSGSDDATLTISTAGYTFSGDFGPNTYPLVMILPYSSTQSPLTNAPADIYASLQGFPLTNILSFDDNMEYEQTSSGPYANGAFNSFTATETAVPEPSTYVLTAVSLLTMGLLSRFRKRFV